MEGSPISWQTFGRACGVLLLGHRRRKKELPGLGMELKAAAGHEVLGVMIMVPWLHVQRLLDMKAVFQEQQGNCRFGARTLRLRLYWRSMGT